MIVCFIGHRNVDNAEQIKNRLKEVVCSLIKNGADTFLFGSRSDFNYICWSVVTELQSEFPDLKRIKYNAPHEVAFTSKEDRERCERIFYEFTHEDAHCSDYEQAVDCVKSLRANKNAYIMRNQEMIDNSDVCVFYYDKNYLPPKRKQSKRQLCDYQPKSGTSIAFDYAKRKKEANS